MSRPVALHTGPWMDVPLEELAQTASEWGYQGLDLACGGDHLEVQRALSQPDYCSRLLELLARCELSVTGISNHRVGQAIGDVIDARHQAWLPDYVWGDGQPAEVRQRAVEEMVDTIRVAQKLGVAVVSGFTGSALWPAIASFPPPTPRQIAELLRQFADTWEPILDVCQECGVRFALEVAPGQIAFDLHSAEQVLDALPGRAEFGFAFSPAQLHWQGVDPVEFARRFPERIYQVFIADIALSLSGRSGIFNSYLPSGDPRRGWDWRSPGHGGIDWEGVIRAVHASGYDGPLTVHWQDPGMDRDHGADDACKFVQRLDFPAPSRDAAEPFREV
ncbi:MAG: sugar phosphate isomerase/epimerase family protein [Gemmataceae bacterium]